MPGPLIGVTIATPHLKESCAAYARSLGYRGEREVIDVGLARHLGEPALAGRGMAVLRPETGGTRFIRLVEGAADPAPLTTFGWSAVELIVRDLDTLAERLADSPFRVIGPPMVLDFDFTDAIRAMQVVGPSGEVLYLTEVGGPVAGFDLPITDAAVGPPFIAVAGVDDLTDWLTKANAATGLASGPQLDVKIGVLSGALGLAADAKHRITTVALGGASYLEIDAFPSPATARRRPHGLPCGIIAVAIGTCGSQRFPPTLAPLRFEWCPN